MNRSRDALLELINFTSRVAVKIHAPLEEAEVYRTVCSEFAASGAYTASVLLLANGGSILRVVCTSLSPAVIAAAQKATGLRLQTGHVNLTPGHSWLKVTALGQTTVFSNRKSLLEWLPATYVDTVVRILGFEGHTSVRVPLGCGNEIIGGLAVTCSSADRHVVASIEALAAHISSAVASARAQLRQAQLMRALAESEQALRSLLDAIPESAFLMEPDGTVLAANAATAQRLHTTLEDLVGTCAYALLPSDVAERRRAYVGQVLSTRKAVVFDDRDRDRRIQHYVYPVLNEAGEVQSLAILGVDISERVRMHSELAMAMRLSSVGLLAASLAHRILNPLAIVSAAAQALDQSSDVELRTELVSKIRAATQRASSVVNELLTSCAPGPLRLLQMKVNNLLEEALELQAPNATALGVSVQRRILPGLPSVWGNELLLQELFHNLIANACEAMPSGGLLEISAQGDRETGLQITFRDTGQGMSPDDLSRVFDPFFTTKGLANHAGLGLFVARHIVRQHRGSITVESDPGQGTTVSIHLPCGPPDRQMVNAS